MDDESTSIEVFSRLEYLSIDEVLSCRLKKSKRHQLNEEHDLVILVINQTLLIHINDHFFEAIRVMK